MAPVFVVVDIFRGVEGEAEVFDVLVWDWEDEAAGFMDDAEDPGMERARKAEKKEAKKGREGAWVGIIVVVFKGLCYGSRRCWTSMNVCRRRLARSRLRCPGTIEFWIEVHCEKQVRSVQQGSVIRSLYKEVI